MRFIQTLLEDDDLSKLSQETVDSVEKNIKAGAKDTEQKWANALELVHKAYEVDNVQRPTPDMEAAWKQYEKMIELAVKELAKKRGLDADWRMSSHIFHESAGSEPAKKFVVSSTIDDLPVVGDVTADSIDEVLAPIMKFNITGHELEIKHRSPNHAVVYFCKDGERTGDKVTIKQKSSDK